MEHPLHLTGLDGAFAVCRLAPDTAPAPWMSAGRFWAIAGSRDELSVVCDMSRVPGGVQHEGPFAAFAVKGPLDFSLTGVLARLSAPLAAAGIPLFAVSTFDTDYILVPVARSAAACEAWSSAGIVVPR